MKSFLTVLTIMGYVLMSSCATVFTGTHDTISFKTTPPGATVSKDGTELCKTPCSASIKRSLNDTQIELKSEGYDTKLITLDKDFNVISVINLTNLIGWGVDALSGALMKYDKKSYDIELTKNGKTSLIIPTNPVDSVAIVPMNTKDSLAKKLSFTQPTSNKILGNNK